MKNLDMMARKFFTISQCDPGIDVVLGYYILHEVISKKKKILPPAWFIKNGSED